MTIQDDKAQARKQAFAARKRAFDQGQGDAALILAKLLQDHAGKALAGYMPMRTEIDPLPAMAAHAGTVGVPVIMGEAQPLRFRQWTPRSTMVEGAFRAMIPETGDWIDPEVIIVPMVAFDAKGYRLGYGGGFYDRTIQELASKHPILTIGFAFSGQELADLPIEPTDQRLDLLVTEKGVVDFR